MESIIPKTAKYLELGESKNAFHGVLLPLFLFFIILISGCSWFADNRILVKPKKVDITSAKYQKILSIMLNRRYESEFLRCLAAEIEYQKYLQEKDDQGKSIRKDDYALERRH